MTRVSRSAARAARRALRLPRWAAGLLLLVAAPVFGQSSQYTAPGGAAAEGPPTAEEIEAQMEAARWQAGPVRLAPWFGLRGLTWEQDVFVDEGEGETSDLTGTVGAGLTAYLPTGPKVFWIVQAMPEYVWWLDLDERNELAGRYGGGVVADLNRLRLAADVHLVEEQSVVSIESPQQVFVERQGVSAAAELDLSAAFVLAAAFADEENDQRLPGAEIGESIFSRLDRSEQTASAELRYEPGDVLSVGAGIERTDTEFAPGARNLSSTGTSPYLRVRLQGNRIAAEGRLVRRELEPEPGSSLLPVEEETGRVRVELSPGWRFTLGLYASRHLTYALAGAWSHLLDERFGATVSAPFGERLSVGAFGETGTADFEPLGAALPRSDDLTAYGAHADYRLGEWLSYRAGFQQVEIDSDLSEFDRDYLRITSTFVLSTGDWIWR
jgi:hypothetical protein